MFIGLTGGISSGKTVAGQWLSRYFDVFDADSLVHELYAEHQDLRQRLAQRFGAAVLTPTGVCRSTLRSLIFRDRACIQELENLVHPLVTEKIRQIMSDRKEARRDCLFQIPLLFEKNWQKHLDYVLLISCSLETQVERCLKRGLGNRDDVLRIINTQMPLAEKILLSDYCIMNNGGLEKFYQSLDNWYQIFSKSEPLSRVSL